MPPPSRKGTHIASAVSPATPARSLYAPESLSEGPTGADLPVSRPLSRVDREAGTIYYDYDGFCRAHRAATPDLTKLAQLVPPQNLDFEMGVLGAALLSQEAAVQAVETCHWTDFYRESHCMIFSAISMLVRRGDPVDVLTVSAALRSRLVEQQMHMEASHHGETLLDRVGGGAYLMNCQQRVPATSSVGYYAAQVRKASVARWIIHTCKVAVAVLHGPDPERVLAVLLPVMDLLSDPQVRRLMEPEGDKDAA